MESDVANGDNDDYIRSMDRRLIVLETRFDTLLPLLANKADLAELKAGLSAEIASLEARIIRWVVATFITLIFGFGGLTLTVLDRMNSLSDRIELIASTLPERGK